MPHIPVPGINPLALEILFEQQRGSIVDMFNMFSGGALERFSVVALVLCLHFCINYHAAPNSGSSKLEQLKKEGESGRRKNQSIH